MLIAIEGIDGSGKATQTDILARRLRGDGRKVMVVRFPQYDKSFFGHEVGRYLNGDFGPLSKVSPKFSSLLYALDRYEALETLKKGLRDGHDVICDRYTGSNIAHQAARVPEEQRREMVDWIRNVEERILGLPTPDLVVFLDGEVATSQQLVAKKDKRSYTNKRFDLHERSRGHLATALFEFRKLAHELNWARVDCMYVNGDLRAVEEIADEIYQEVARARERA